MKFQRSGLNKQTAPEPAIPKDVKRGTTIGADILRQAGTAPAVEYGSLAPQRLPPGWQKVKTVSTAQADRPMHAQARYVTVSEASRIHPAFTEAAIRHLIWQAEAHAKHPKPGLRSYGFLNVIVRVPGKRKVLLDLLRFEQWLNPDCGRGANGSGSIERQESRRVA